MRSQVLVGEVTLQQQSFTLKSNQNPVEYQRRFTASVFSPQNCRNRVLFNASFVTVLLHLRAL